MRRYIFAAALVVPLALCTASVFSARVGQGGKADATDFAADKRLEKRVTLDFAGQPLRKALPELRRQTGVPVQIQGDLLKRAVILQHQDRAGADVLRDVADALNATWVKRGDNYILVEDETTARLSARYREMGETRADMNRLVAALTREQRTALQQRGRLSFDSLPVEQQEIFQSVLIDEFFRKTEAHPGKIVHGMGCELRWVKSAGRLPDSISFCAPMIFPDERTVIAQFHQVWLPQGYVR